MDRGFSTYKKINTMGMSQLDLILTVYRGAIGYLDQAQIQFNEGRLTEGRTACEKARKCLVHLYTTLDMDKGGAIATQLGQLYAFVIQQIDLAVASKSHRLIDEVKGILGTIKSAWESLKEQEKAQPHSRPPATGEETKITERASSAMAAAPSSHGKRLTFSA